MTITSKVDKTDRIWITGIVLSLLIASSIGLYVQLSDDRLVISSSTSKSAISILVANPSVRTRIGVLSVEIIDHVNHTAVVSTKTNLRVEPKGSWTWQQDAKIFTPGRVYTITAVVDDGGGNQVSKLYGTNFIAGRGE